MILAYFRSLPARFFHRRRTESEMEEELSFHVQRRTDELERSGLTRAEAERRARIEFGSTEKFKEECREAIAGNFLDILIQDVRFSLRILRKSPGFTAVIILTMAVGIGATTAIFSLIDATLLHPLPYPNAGQLVQVVDDLPGVGAKDVGISIPEWHDLESSGIFEHVAPIGGGDVNLTGSSQSTRIAFLNVPPNYFALLAVKPELGRTFDPKDKTPGFNLEVVISDKLWRETFGSDPQILGKKLRLDNDLYRVIGVMAPQFCDPLRTIQQRNTQIWAASGFAAPPAPAPLRGSRLIPEAIGRLSPSLSLSAAQSRVNALVAALQKEFPGDYPSETGWRVRLVPLKESVIGNVHDTLILLFAAVAFVLVIGCVNVANLLLARATVRGREMAIRRAMGGSGTRLMQQLFTESIILSLLGGGAGLVMLYAAKGFLLRLVPETLPQLNTISVNWTVLLFAFAVSLISGAVFGLVPAWQASRANVADVLKLEGRSSTGSRGQARTRRLLVTSEFALALILMVAAGLLLRSFWDLLKVKPGFNPDNTMVVRTWLPVPNDPSTDIYGSPAQEGRLHREILRRVKALSAVQEAAIGNMASIPLAHTRTNLNLYPFIRESHETPKNRSPIVSGLTVTPDYFHLLQISLLSGRAFTENDDDKAPLVVIINEAMARKYWPSANPIGDRLKLPIPGDPSALLWNTIIGIVADSRTESLADNDNPQFYFCDYQRRPKDMAIFLRGRFDRAAMPRLVREQVQAVDPELPVFGDQTLDNALSQSLAQPRFSMEVVGLFAITALLLAAIGIYGVISYIVNERRQEIGVRIALGAERKDILQMILRQGLRLALAGAGIGLLGAVIVSRLMIHLLYGVQPTDPLTIAAVVVLFVGVALLACYFPARSATKVDPIIALHES